MPWTEQVVALDVTVFRWINSHHSAFLDNGFGLIGNLGSGWVVGPILLGLLVGTVPRAHIVRVVFLGVLAMVSSGVISSQIKHAVTRQRPVAYFAAHEGEASRAPEFEVHVVGEPLRRRSFPSGHTTTAFAAATLLVVVLGRRASPALLLAALVAYSRVYTGVHFPLDTLAGALIGASVTVAIVLPFTRGMRRRRSEEPSPGPVAAG